MKKYVLFITIVICLFFGCSIKRERTVTVVPKTLGSIITDSIAPPVVTRFTAANAPKVIKAAKPTIVPLTYPYGVGVPNFTNYNVADGLPGSFVLSAAKDHDGNLWFSTPAGISKYDGATFTNYNKSNGLASEFTFKLLIDSKNNVWIGTSGDGLSRFDGKYFSRMVMNKDLPANESFTRSIMEDKRGNIWIWNRSGFEIYKYSNNKFTRFTVADGLADSKIVNVIQDKSGDLLISTAKGISAYDGKSFRPYTKLPNNIDGRPPHLLYCDNKGDIWFTYKEGELGRFDGTEIKFYTKKDGYQDGGDNFLEDKAGNYWFTGRNGLTKFDGKHFITYTEKDGLPSSWVIGLTVDEVGNLWAATNNGISKISYSYFTFLEQMKGSVLHYLSVDKDGNKWVSAEEGLYKYSKDQITIYGKELLTPDTGLRLTLIDRHNNIWFALNKFGQDAYSAVVKFDGIDYTFFEKEQGIPNSQITSIIQDDLDNIWVACNEGGVIKINNDSTTQYHHTQVLPGNSFYRIFQDSKRNFWIGTSKRGVYKYNGQSFTAYNTNDGLPDNYVNDITEDPFGNIWLATDGGAARFDGNKFTSFRASEGLSNQVSNISNDTINKIIWFKHGIGLVSLKYEDINLDNPSFQHYNQQTGFAFYSSAGFDLYVDKQGGVWGDGADAIFRFDHTELKGFKPPPIRIKNIRLNGKNISWYSLRSGEHRYDSNDSSTAVNEMALRFGKSLSDKDFEAMSDEFGRVTFDSITSPDFLPANLTIPFQNNNISFQFGSISPTFGKYARYQFKMQGYENDWSELSTKTEANFGNMSEGNYTFQVKALSPAGTWSEISYSFNVLPPWYRTWWAYALYVILFVSGVGLFIRWRTKALQEEKTILEEKVATRTNELKESLDNLKSTQSQLIQSEKMASLGELTAGIAHEIQNPLNFVNNFSEVSSELVDEMKTELATGNVQLATEISNDLKQNLEKINHHGKRAADIVKGMLQHSRSSSGVKEPTDINALADEYLRLAYHGLRAKDKSFNATMKTDFDESIGNINIIPQDIGRVILNLITNAFYAVNEKVSSYAKASEDKYEPTVSVSTKKEGNKVSISVKDNGNGIPQKILEKIFQPFFTTKPTGQGTGLGLSLSYDIVKAHGGELKVVTKHIEGLSAESSAQVGTELTIQLPI